MIAPEQIEKVVSDTKHDTLEELLVDIGLGNAMSIVIAQRLKGDQEQIEQIGRAHV